jgi:hypothetical protein
MYAFEESTTIDGDVSAVWRTVSDAAAWSTWDPHVLNCGFEGPFEPGSIGWTLSRLVSGRRGPFEVIDVQHERSYTTRSPMPFGKMLITNRYEQASPGKVHVSRRVETHGPFAPIFRMAWAKAFQADTRATFQALEKEAGRRAARTGGEL